MEKTVAAEVEEIKQSFKLEDIVPQNAEVVINGRPYTLRKITLADEAWLKAQGNVEQKFIQEDMDFIAKFAFRLLVDKTDFLPVERDGHDDDGNAIKLKVTGPQRILEGMSGPEQKYDLFKALCQTLGISRPLMDKMVEERLKKSPTPPNRQARRAGAKSST